MREQTTRRRAGRAQAGVSLLEVLIAVTILGLSFTAMFAGFSTALRTTGRLDHYNQVVAFANSKLNEVVAEGKLAPGQELSGVSERGWHWRARAELAEQRPGLIKSRPLQLLRVTVQVTWSSPNGEQSLALETLKLRIPNAETT